VLSYKKPGAMEGELGLKDTCKKRPQDH